MESNLSEDMKKYYKDSVPYFNSKNNNFFNDLSQCHQKLIIKNNFTDTMKDIVDGSLTRLLDYKSGIVKVKINFNIIKQIEDCYKLQSILQKDCVPKNDFYVYRSVHNLDDKNNKFLPTLKEGDSFVQPIPFSTSHDPDFPPEWLYSRKPESRSDCCIYKIKLKKDSKYIIINEDISDQESEVLLLSGILTVKKVNKVIFNIDTKTVNYTVYTCDFDSDFNIIRDLQKNNKLVYIDNEKNIFVDSFEREEKKIIKKPSNITWAAWGRMSDDEKQKFIS